MKQFYFRCVRCGKKAPQMTPREAARNVTEDRSGLCRTCYRKDCELERQRSEESAA